MMMKKNNFSTFKRNPFAIPTLKYTIDICALFFSCLTAKYILQIPLTAQWKADFIFIIFSSGALSFFSGIYKNLWRFTSLYNVGQLVKHCFILTVLFSFWSYAQGIQDELLLKISFLFFLFSFFALNFSRIFARITFDEIKSVHDQDAPNAIVIGAGKGSDLFIRESKKRPDVSYNIKGILDDDPTLWGKKLFNIKVYGPIKDLAKLADVYDIDLVVIAIPSLSKEKLIEMTEMIKEIGLQVRVLPSFNSILMDGHTPLADISIEDLLGRDSINLDKKDTSDFIENKTVLITGAGGSIGSEICRQLIPLKPKSIIMIDHSEFNLYEISWEIEHNFKYAQFIPILANVTDTQLMDTVFDTHRPQIVFHAAAYKHVPLLENQAKQAIKNNFLGTKNVAEMASRYHAEKFILISTDKAVNPTNIMGSTKRMAEIFCQNFNAVSSTNYVTVRFGNVLGSAGSVIPLFTKQLRQGGPLTVTHPDITRYFMSIPEASQLVLQAGAMGTGGEIFVLDMGKPIKISHLAERLITLNGKRPYKDVDIVFTGLRPGEKLYEELFYDNEKHAPTKRHKIFLAQSVSVNFENFIQKTQILETALQDVSSEKLVEIILEMVPEAKINTAIKSTYGVDHT